MSASEIERATTAANQDRWLQAFELVGSSGAASLETGIPLGTSEGWIRNDTNGFKSRRAEAGQIALGHYEREMYRRGVEGWEKPLHHQGKLTGDFIKEYSDNLLMIRVKRLDPNYKDNYTPQQAQPVAITQINIHLPASHTEVTPLISSETEVIEGGVRETEAPTD